MPNWCANRVMVNGAHEAVSAVTALMQGECIPYYEKAISQSIKLFVAGCAGVLRTTHDACYAPYIALTSRGKGESTTENQAFTAWLKMLEDNVALTKTVCAQINALYTQAQLTSLAWSSLSKAEQGVIADLFKHKGCDWVNSYFSPQSAGVLWHSLGQDGEGKPFDMLLIEPTRIACEINGFNGKLLSGVESAYDFYLRNHGVKWPTGASMSVDSGTNWMTADFDTPWSPPEGDLFRQLSARHDCLITHYYSESGSDFCGYAVYDRGEMKECACDSLEYGQYDENGECEVIAPDYIMDNIAHFGG